MEKDQVEGEKNLKYKKMVGIDVIWAYNKCNNM
jgi:hypothetical protein